MERVTLSERENERARDYSALPFPKIAPLVKMNNLSPSLLVLVRGELEIKTSMLQCSKEYFVMQIVQG